MNEIFSSALMIIGAAFALLAGAGVVRMPDLFTRMQAATKASTLGIGCLVLAVPIHFGELGITTRAIATIIFVFLTAPVAAHMIARAAYFVGVPLWERTIIDELHGHYDRRTHKLARPDDPFAMLPMTVDLARLTGQTVLVGYGRVGGRIGEALVARGVSIVVVEDNREIVEKLRARDVPAVFGNAAEPGVLIQAHVHKASMLVIATPDAAQARRMVGIARRVNPGIEIVARTHTEEEAAFLERSAEKVFLGEHELALTMTRYVLGRYSDNK
ncbi:MAG: monovalent cation/H(+) antiporter subunit G [Candidatus Binatia bacterium]